MNNTKKGFTLVELLVVIAILAILATVSVVGYTSFITNANESVAIQELTQIRNYMIADDYTNSAFDLEADTLDDDSIEKVIKAYIAEDGELSELDGAVSVDDGVVTYTVKGAKATWNIATNAIAGAGKAEATTATTTTN